jgi:drug/metabolite transporter (DMT)-like permease
VTGVALALVVAAAFIHAAWNALAKRGRDPLTFLWSCLSVASALFLPVAAWRIAVEGLPARAVPFIAATVILHALYFYALGRAYASAEFSLVYPVARGLGVALVPVLAYVVFAERLSPLGTAGVALVVVGIVALHGRPAAWHAVSADGSRRLGAGTAWAVLTGVIIATYSLVDKAGVALVSPLTYIALLGAGSSALLLPAVLRRRAALRREWAENARAILVASVLNLTSYLLVLFAFRLAKVSYVVAGRELSIVVSAFIGALWLDEGRLGPRLVGAAIVLAGVVSVALAR